MSEPSYQENRSLTSAIINAVDNTQLAAKLTIIQEELSVASSTTQIEVAFQKYQKHLRPPILNTRHASSKTQSYHTRDIIYNLYGHIIFKNKKEIKFISIADFYFIENMEKFGHWMDIVDAVGKPDHILSLKKNLDKAELEHICYYINE